MKRSQHKKKRTTEESFILDASSLAHGEERPGVLRPVRIGGRKKILRAHYRLDSFGADPVVGLRYAPRRDTDETIEQTVPLCSTTPGFGRKKLWLVRALVGEDGSPCGRRVGKPYLPPGERYFGCKTRHNLAYKSSRKSHSYDGICRLMAGEDEGERFWFLKRSFRDRIRETRNHALNSPPLTLVEKFDSAFGKPIDARPPSLRDRSP